MMSVPEARVSNWVFFTDANSTGIEIPTPITASTAGLPVVETILFSYGDTVELFTSPQAELLIFVANPAADEIAEVALPTTPCAAVTAPVAAKIAAGSGGTAACKIDKA